MPNFAQISEQEQRSKEKKIGELWFSSVPIRERGKIVNFRKIRRLEQRLRNREALFQLEKGKKKKGKKKEERKGLTVFIS